MKYLFGLWKKHFPMFFLGTIGGALRNLGITLLNALFAEKIIAAFGMSGQTGFGKGWIRIIFVIIVFCAADAVFLMIHQVKTHDMVCDLKNDIFKRIIGAELFTLGKQGEKGSIISNFSSDVELISDCLKYQILTPVMMLISGIGAFASLTAITGRIDITITVLVFAGLMIWCQNCLGKFILTYRKTLQEKIAEGTKLVVYSFEKRKTVLESGQGEMARYLLNQINEECRYYDKKVSRLRAINEVIGEMSNIFRYVSGPIIGIWLFSIGAIHISQIVLIGPMVSLLYNFGISWGNIVVMLKETQAGFEKVNQFYLLEQEKEEGTIDVIDKSAEPLIIYDLSFAYADGTKVFQNFSSGNVYGSVIGIEGDSGSGKSTLIKILMGLLPYKGSISVFGNEINTYSKRFLRSTISYIPQSGFLLPGGLINNLCIDSDSTYTLDAKRALEIVGMPDDIIANDWQAKSLDHLSGGEKQRVALARALLTEAKILILDETFSGIDRKERYLLMEVIKKKFAGNLILVISHDDDLLSMCDSILRIGGE